MQRRGFLKFAVGGVAGIVASPMIWDTLYDAAYWTQNWGWIPRLQYGENHYIPTVSKVDPGGTPIRVRLVGDRVTRTLGNPDSEISGGGLTALAASEGQLLYTESRIRRPLKRGPDGGYRFISWEEAEAILIEKTKEAEGSCAFISSDTTSTLNELFSAFLTATGSEDYFFMSNEENAAARAWELMGGNGRIGYDLENSDYILSLGANLLESWGTVARNRKIFKETHQPDQEPTMLLAYASAMQNNTAVVADLWLPTKPGTEAVLALAIARELIQRGYGNGLFGITEFAALCEPYTVEHMSKVCGLMPSRFEELMQGLLKAKRPIVLYGSAMGQGGGAAPVMAAIAVNMILGRIGKEGNLVDLPLPPKVLGLSLGYRKLQENNLIEYSQNIALGMKKAPKLLFVYESNPFYSWPVNVGMKEFLDSVGYSISFSGYWDETSAQCDLILPSAFGLERFDDVYTPYGSGYENWTLAKPVAKPRHQARPIGEVIIALAEELGYDLGVKDVPSLLSLRGEGLGASFKEYVENGQSFISDRNVDDGWYRFATDIIKTALKDIEYQETRLLPHVVYAIGSATTGIPPYANRVIADYQLKNSKIVAQMNSVTAKKFDLKDDDIISIETDSGKILALVAIFEGIMPEVISLPAGLGHTAFDGFSSNKGENILKLASVHLESGTGFPVWGDSGLKIIKR